MQYLSILISLLIILSCASPNSQNEIQRLDGSTMQEEQLTQHIQALVDSANVSGLTVSIFNEHSLRYQKAFGYSNVASNDSLQTNQIFYGASLSKAVFGYIVAELVQEGKIDLDKPLEHYLEVPLPEMPFKREWRNFSKIADDPRYKIITPRMCMAHTTGLPNWRWLSREGEFTPDGEIKIYFDPGTEYSYSGEGIRLLQKVMEQHLDVGLEELAQDRVFTPLEMNMSSYVWQDRFEDVYVNGHTKDQQIIEKDIEDEAGAAGSMETTPEDYAKFLTHVMTLASNDSEITNILFEPNIEINSKKQFGPLSLEKTDANKAIGLNYGLGWGILDSPYGKGYFKEGHSEGFQHYSIIFPEAGIGMLLMANSDNAESIFKELLELGIKDTYTPWYWEHYIPYNM